MTYTTLTIIATYFSIQSYTDIYRVIHLYYYSNYNKKKCSSNIVLNSIKIYRYNFHYTLTTRLISSVPISCTNIVTTPLVITCCIHSTLPLVT